VASALPPLAPAEAPRPTPAASPAQIARNQPARSIPAWQAVPGPQAGASPPVVFPGSSDLGAAAAVPEPRRGRTEPAELVDSMGVPGQSCLWIPRYSGVSRTSSHAAFNKCLLLTGYHTPNVAAMLCTPSHTVPYQERHTIREGVSAKKRERTRIHLARHPKCYDQEFGRIVFCTHIRRQETQTQKPQTHRLRRRKSHMAVKLVSTASAALAATFCAPH